MSGEGSASTTPHLYRPCVGIVLLNPEGLVFVGERIDTPGAWQMPQGGIDEGETLEEALFRELREEIGTDKAELLQIAPEPLRYDLPPALIKKLWNGLYRGQEQRWAALRFTGTDSDINIEYHEIPEFSAWEWVKPEDTLERIVPFKRDTYRQVFSVFSDLFRD